MGNCIFVQTKVIKIVKADGKILEYKAPMRGQQVLSEFSGHQICYVLPALRHLWPDTKLVRSGLYYLVPVPRTLPQVTKTVRFSTPEVEAAGQDKGVVRVKVVITKQEQALRVMQNVNRIFTSAFLNNLIYGACIAFEL